jgi:hypothetical protein
MRIRDCGLLMLALALAGLAGSCATSGGVDTTPTLRTKADAHIGKGWTSDSTRVETITDDFMPNETIHAIVDMPSRIDGTIRVRWVFGESETIEEKTMTLQSDAKVNVYPFQLAPPATGHRVGDYKFEVYVNEDLADTEKFHVRAG